MSGRVKIEIGDCFRVPLSDGRGPTANMCSRAMNSGEHLGSLELKQVWGDEGLEEESLPEPIAATACSDVRS
jgi:hypothetical protein